MLEVKDLCWNAGKTEVLKDISLKVKRGETLGLVGPNGSGKSSLVRLLAGLRPSNAGTVRFLGSPLPSLSRKKIARHIALVEQQAETTDSIRVRDVVELGRTPHLGVFNALSEKDRQAVEAALSQVGMSHMADRRWHTLSGGERQRVHIARALAQQPEILLLDEPTNHLDIRHQIGILSLVRRLGLTAVLVLHDLNLAAMFCDRIAVMQMGRIVMDGPVEAVLTPPLIRTVFGVEAAIQQNDGDGAMHIRFQREVA